jgi:hypothetical protein
MWWDIDVSYILTSEAPLEGNLCGVVTETPAHTCCIMATALTMLRTFVEGACPVLQACASLDMLLH